MSILIQILILFQVYNMKVRELVKYAIFLAIAVIASYIEHLVVLPFLFPGAKLGLANTIGLIILYIFGKEKYVVFGLLRVLLSALLFNGFGTTFLISLGGNIFASIITIALLFNKKISIYGLSVNGAIFHGIGQIIVVSIIYQTVQMFNYAIILTISGIISGLLMAMVTKVVINKIPRTLLG